MLDITVKTLDSQSRVFSVPDDVTVKEFKEKISASVDVPVDRQRLIFQGRVLQDDAQLNADGNINGKVIHLVERLPAPVEPTPAQLARQPQPQASSAPSSAPSVQPPPPHNPANVLGPFPMPEQGQNLNSGHFVQQMIQQALSGMTSPIGPAVVRGSVRHPNAPGGDSRTEIQIQITPQGSSRAARNVQARQAAQTSQPSATQQRGSTAQRPPPMSQPMQSAPRQGVHSIHCLLNRLEEHINNLEAAKSGQGNDQPGTSSEAGKSETASASTEPMEVQSEPTTPQPEGAAGSSTTGKPPGGEASGSRNENDTGHPSFPFVGRLLRRLTGLETRFLPFQMEFADFLERDPPFTSRESPEFTRTQTFLTEVLKVQRTLGAIHRSLSVLVLPLSDTPPRHVLIQAGPRQGAHPATAHRIQNAATAGSYLNQTGPPRHHHGPPVMHGPHHQVGMPILVGPIGPGVPSGVRPSMIRMPMFGFTSSQPRPTPPHASGLYGHPSPQPQRYPSGPAQPLPAPVATGATASTGATTSTGATASIDVEVTTTATSASRMPPQPNASSAPSSGATRVEFAPPGYTLQVTTHIQPNINVNITPGLLGGATAQSQSNAEVAGEFDRTTVTAAEINVEVPEEQVDETPMDEESLPPVELIFPNIPGISQDGMRHIIESVQNSIQQLAGPSQRPTTMQSGTISITGFPEGPNQVPTDIASIIGQTVQDVVLNHIHGVSQQPQAPTTQTTTTTAAGPTESAAPQSTSVPANTTSETTAPISTTASASTTASVSATASTATTASTHTTTSTSSQSGWTQSNSRNSLARLLSQITGGVDVTPSGSDSVPAASSAVSDRKVEGHVGRGRRRLPPIRRTVNCLNDVVRGQGYPRQMMELTGHESILSFLIFLTGELMTIPDCVGFMTGATEPANRLRGPMRQALVECWFDGNVPNRDQIEVEVERESEATRAAIEECFKDAKPKSSDVSVVESNLSFYRFILRRILHLLFLHDREHFARDMSRHIMNCYAIVLQLNINILRGTEEDVVKLVMTQVGGALDAFTMGPPGGGTDPMAQQMRGMIQSQMLPFLRNRSVSQDQIDQFVMNVPRPVTPEMEVAPEPAQEEVEVASNEQTTGSAPQVEPDTAVEMNVASGDTGEEAKQEEIDAAAAGEGDWRSMVPEEWIPVISSDIEKQKDLPEQAPYSDAYLAGMPASKRRKI